MKLKTLILCCLGFNLAQAQFSFPITNTAPTGTASGVQSGAFWARAGNNLINGTNNLFGTLWDSPIFMATAGFQRLQIDHRSLGQPLQVYPGALTNPLPGNRLTRVGINRDGTKPIAHPLSLLHLGYEFPFTGVAAGFRSWQDIGTMYGSETDNFYVGFRQKNPVDPTGRTSEVTMNTTDANDAVISWGDNYPLNGPGPDDNLTFLFHAPIQNALPFASTDYGREVLRMTGVGNVGIGPVFFDNAQPQNILHINNNAQNATYMQITNQGGSGQTANSGFHIGITAGAGGGGFVAELRQKENRDMRFYTNDIQQAVIKNSGRVGFNINNPINEVQISSRPTTPYGLTGSGLRFTNLTSANAVIPNAFNGVNYNRVLTVDGFGDVVLIPSALGIANNGISIVNGTVQLGATCGSATTALAQLISSREIPLNNFNFIFRGQGVGATNRVGIGVLGCAPGNKLEIDNGVANPNTSGLRLTRLTSASPTNLNPGPGVLTVDASGDVIYVPGANPQANNGLSVVNGSVQLGATCPSGTFAAANLTSDRQIPLNGFNMMYAGANGSVGIGLPINACVPNNKLEVDNNTGPNPLSGLRLTDLAGATPLATNNRVLSVNPAGDVILTNVPFTGFGNLCTAAQNSLTGDFEMPLGTNKYLFTGQGIINATIQQDVVAVGYSCSTLPPSRFSVLEDQTNQPQQVQTYAAHFKNNNQADATFIPTSFIETAGVFAEAKRAATGLNINNINIGGIFEGFNARNTIGVVGRCSKSTPNITNPSSAPLGIAPRYAIGGAFMSDSLVNNPFINFVDNYGVYARAKNGTALNIGVYTETDASAGQNYALYASAPSSGNAFAGYFNGDVVRTGVDNFTSDAILKQNFDSIPNALNIINQLQPKTFDYKLAQYPQMSLPSGLQYGLVAQDIQSVLPALVNSATHPERTIGSTTYPAFTYSTVEYTQLIPILIRAVQQLSNQNHKLDSMITALTQSVSSCCSNSAARQTGITGNTPNAVNQLNIDLTDKDIIVLNQNVPNPFAEQTTITYNVPEKYGYAQLVFKTIDGKIIKTVDITKKGRGQVNVFANDLSNGLYMYSLVVDGATIDTKKMVKQN